MKNQTIFRFAVLCALFGASAALSAPAFAQKDDRNGRSGSAKEDRNRAEAAQNKNKEGRGGSSTGKSDGRRESANKGRKDRR